MFTRAHLLGGLAAALLIVLAGLVGTATAAAQTQAAPFKGTFTATDTLLPPTPECPLLIKSESVGEATHLGRFTTAGVNCGFNFRVEEDPPFNPGGGPPYLVADIAIDETWTAANGDQLSITGHGVFVQSMSDPGPGGLRATATVDGGSGRFLAATGEIHASQDADETAISFDGWIAYDASNASG